MMMLLSKLNSTHFYAYYEEDEIIGFSYFGVKKNITFITYIAVKESKRSQGYGKRILNHIQLLFPNNKIILGIEPSYLSYIYTQRSKRKRFYLMNGFLETEHYIKLGGQELELLIKNGEFLKEELFLFFLRYSNFTMFKKIYKKS
jgi:GNAT superfamily N-acetyltransferase